MFVGTFLPPVLKILAMLEEAAGTRMYETKRTNARKTIDKKDSKLNEIDKVNQLLWYCYYIYYIDPGRGNHSDINQIKRGMIVIKMTYYISSFRSDPLSLNIRR